MALLTPTADLALVYSLDAATGEVVVDLALTPTGDLALVVGMDRLVQDVTRYLLTPRGSNPHDPEYGNPLFGLIGLPYSQDTAIYADMLADAEATFLARQAVTAAQGGLALDELVDHFSPPTIVADPRTASVTISFLVISQSGQSSAALVTFVEEQ